MLCLIATSQCIIRCKRETPLFCVYILLSSTCLVPPTASLEEEGPRILKSWLSCFLVMEETLEIYQCLA